MSLHAKYFEILSTLLPAGMVGAFLLLGPATPGKAHDRPSGAEPAGAGAARISERLAAIREAVSAVSDNGGAAEATSRLVWGNVMGKSRWGNIIGPPRKRDRYWGNQWGNNWNNTVR